MFNIVPVNSLPENVTVVLRGAQLAYWDAPQIFQLTSEVATEPFYISVIFIKDTQNKEANLDIGRITGNRLDIKLTNPHELHPTVTKRRVSLLNLRDGNLQLTFSMLIMSPNDSPHVLFYYEFYEEPIEEEPKVPTQEAQSEVLS